MIPLVFNITDFQMPKTASATAYITGASGKTKKKLCDVVGNRITLEPTSDLFSVGNNDIQIRIVNDTKTLVTFNTNCYCENSVEFGDAAGEKEQTLIEQLLASQGKIQTGLNNEVEERKKQAKNLEDNKLDKTGDASNTTIDFTESLNRENIVTGENARTMFGKIAKWFSDIKEAAFAKVANNLDTTEEGYVLDARQGKKIKEDIADLNSKIDPYRVIDFNTTGRTTYVKYANGVMIQFGTASVSYTDGYGTATFAHPFIDTSYAFFTTGVYINSTYPFEIITCQKVSNNKTYIYSRNMQGNKVETHAVDWLAIGKWK